MTKEKTNRLIVSFTVAGVLLVLILCFVMVYQLLAINARKNKEAELNDLIAQYEQQISEAEDGIDNHNAKWWLERRLRELGYYFPGDKTT